MVLKHSPSLIIAQMQQNFDAAEWRRQKSSQEIYYTPYVRPQVPEEWANFVEARRVNSVKGMPKDARWAYEQVARYFPGYPVLAFGSRVVGDYVDAMDSDEWREARVRYLGKRWVIESDYDVFVPFSREVPKIDVGAQVDLVTQLPRIVGYSTVLVNQDEFLWDFSKLPREEHARAIAALDCLDHQALLQIHNDYKLSPHRYCCDTLGVVAWFRWARFVGLIRESDG